MQDKKGFWSFLITYRTSFCFAAIEAWVIVCVLFVFGALIEYAGLLLKIKIGTTRGVPRVPKKSPSVNRENSLALNGNVKDHKATLIRYH